MIIQNSVLTLIVASAAAAVGWEFAGSSWGPMQRAALCLAIPSFVLWSVARFQLGKSFAVTAQARQLVTHGLYSRIRNPIYVFGSLFIVGYILLLQRPRWLLIFALIVPLQVWRSRKEAQVLEAKFGDEYRIYRRQTWF
ncbi:MAG: isoprenylcysteine carboxylmethyltransferase family protein [Acidobacteriaceae bacterium]|nr:isoprenylcysteine carboxylmethyltransferase family protein [Acidobacteriaceae bacterium]